MPMINLDLEDGLPPISFPVSENNLERFIEFMAQQQRQTKALEKIALNTLDGGDKLSLDDCRKLAREVLYDE